MSWARVADRADPRLADYRDLTDPELRRHHDAMHGVFIVEGHLAVGALAESPHAASTRSVLVDGTKVDRMGPIIERLAELGAAVLVAPPEVLRATIGFSLHRGVLAAVDRPAPTDPAPLLAGAGTLLAVEGINDHENLGGLFRVAAAFGVDAVLLDPTCADPWYRRSVRVSLGHVLHVPHARVDMWPGELADLADAGVQVVALSPGAATLLPDIEPPGAGDDQRLVVAVGAEGPGLSTAALGVDGVTPTRIAMAPGVDSLNVATAAAVALAHLVGPRLR